MGVFAPLVGVIGSMQAVEALKLLAPCGEPARGKLVVYEALAGEWRTLKVRRDPGCAVCRRRLTVDRARADWQHYRRRPVLSRAATAAALPTAPTASA